MDKTEEEKGQEASEGDQAGVLLSELEFIVSRNHAVVPSIIQCCGIHVYYCVVWKLPPPSS